MRLGDLCEVVRGSSPRPQGDPKYFGGNVPRLMIADVTRDGKYVTPIIDSLTKEGAKKSRPMKKDDVVIAVSGDPGRPCILAVDACIHDGFVGLRNVNENKIIKTYLYSFLNYFKLANKKNAVGAIFQNLTTDQIKKIEIPEISIENQKKIVQLLDQTENLLSLRRESIDLLDEFLKSTFLDMFGDPVLNEKKYLPIKLDEVCDDIFLGLTSKVDYVESEGYPLIRATDINSGKLSFENVRYISERQHKLITKNRITKRGDLLVSKSGSLGTCAIVDSDREFTTYESIITIQSKKEFLNNYFLIYLLRNQNFQIKMLGGKVGGTVGHLNLQMFRSISINLPPIELQNKFATIVEKVESLKKEYEASLLELENLYGVLSQKAFKGELNIKNINFNVMEEFSVSEASTDKEIESLKKFYSNFNEIEKKNLVFDFERELFFKIVDKENNIIGIGSVLNGYSSYDNLKRFINPTHRGKKIAEKLLDKIIEYSISNNKTRLTGYFKTEEKKAKSFFESKGFKIIDGGIKIDGQKYSTAILNLNSYN